MDSDQLKQSGQDDVTKTGETEVFDDVEFESYNDDDPKGGSSSPAERIKKLKERIKTLEEERQEYLDGWQRAKADFVNYKKREEESKQEFSKYAREGTVSDLLPVLESFDMAFANKEAWGKVDQSWRVGVEYIYGQFLGVLKDHGLTEISPIGETFDASVHTAIENVPTDDPAKEHRIAEVVQKGYALAGKLIRSPKVKVFEMRPPDAS
jgi:molecular chaperone GrpE